MFISCNNLYLGLLRFLLQFEKNGEVSKLRRDAREAAYKVLYAENYNGISEESFVKEIYDEQKLIKADKVFADKLIDCVRTHREEIEKIISDYAKGYKLERLYSTDKCALMLAIAEMKYFDDIPAVVSIDEALCLVRKYSTEESLKFVNGILASFKKNAEEKASDN